MRAKNVLIAAAMAVVLLAGTRAGAQVLLTDSFEYADTTALGAVWTRSSTTNFALNSTGFNPIPDTAAPGEDPATVAYNGTETNTNSGVSKLGRFNNAAYGTRALSSAVTADTGWSIKFDLVFETYSRNAGIGLLNSATGAGYTLQWNAGNPNASTGRGVVTIHERSASALAAQNYGTAFANGRRPSYTNGTTYGAWPSGAPLSFSFANNGNAYHPVIGYRVDATDGTTAANTQTYSPDFSGLAQFQLVYTPSYSRTGASGTETGARLALYVIGPANPDSTIPIFDVVDITPLLGSFSFDQLYLTGASANFDNITVEAIPAPEPASIGLMGGLGLLLLRRRSRIGAIQGRVALASSQHVR